MFKALLSEVYCLDSTIVKIHPHVLREKCLRCGRKIVAAGKHRKTGAYG
jgi:hypothetical protein